MHTRSNAPSTSLLVWVSLALACTSNIPTEVDQGGRPEPGGAGSANGSSLRGGNTGQGGSVDDSRASRTAGSGGGGGATGSAGASTSNGGGTFGSDGTSGAGASGEADSRGAGAAGSVGSGGAGGSRHGGGGTSRDAGTGGSTGRGGAGTADNGGGTAGSSGSGGAGTADNGGGTGRGGAGTAGTSGSGGADGCVPNTRCKPTPPPSTGDIHQDCVNRINQFLTDCACLPALARAPEGEACADQMAQYDADQNQAHAGATAGVCKPSGSQNECPGYSSNSQVISLCMQQMWDEGPPPTNSCTGTCFEEHGHYIIMTGRSVTKVACGFYTTSSGKVWAVQNFLR